MFRHPRLFIVSMVVEKGVHEQEVASPKVKLSDLKKEDLGYRVGLAAYWDTLGWVHFRMGNYEKAEKYLNAAWTVSKGAIKVDHLGQVYEKQRKSQAAIHAYQLALAVSTGKPGVTDNLPEKRTRLEHLRPGGSTFNALFTATNELTTIRSFKFARLTAGSTTAECFLLFSPDQELRMLSSLLDLTS